MKPRIPAETQRELNRLRLNEKTASEQYERMQSKISGLEAYCRKLEDVRKDQVEELLNKQAELMADVADLLCRCTKLEGTV